MELAKSSLDVQKLVVVGLFHFKKARGIHLNYSTKFFAVFIGFSFVDILKFLPIFVQGTLF